MLMSQISASETSEIKSIYLLPLISRTGSASTRLMMKASQLTIQLSLRPKYSLSESTLKKLCSLTTTSGDRMSPMNQTYCRTSCLKRRSCRTTTTTSLPHRQLLDKLGRSTISKTREGGTNLSPHSRGLRRGPADSSKSAEEAATALPATKRLRLRDKIRHNST